MKKFIKDLGTNLLAGLLVTVFAAFIGIKVALPQISSEDGNIGSIVGGLIGLVFILLFLGFCFFALYLKFKLLDQQDKETAEITKLQIKEEAEIEKLKLQKENQQSPLKSDEN